MIAALFVMSRGVYSGLPDVDVWDEQRDARLYPGQYRVIAHPPCERWGRYWHGSPRKPHQYQLGDDSGCFAAALKAVREFGGVLEHPAYSHAWQAFDLPRPVAGEGWRSTLFDQEMVCHVEQGHYGHMARKATWLLTCRVEVRELIWTPAPQRLPAVGLARHGYEKARRSGVMAYVGGKDKKAIRGATPVEFRDLLLSMVRT